jgi:hypothetical protein
MNDRINRTETVLDRAEGIKRFDLDIEIHIRRTNQRFRGTQEGFAKGEPSTQVDLTRSPRRWGMGAICVGQSLRIASVQVALGFAAA